MQIGEIIANLFATVLLLGLLAIMFFVSGKQLLPERTARMVIVLPVDAIKTAAFKNTHLNLPSSFNVGVVQPRPDGRRQ
ncbi:MULTISPECIES: polymerase [unclassified Mesorhizobium]|uniref:polymerase n=1 Tax=unclassified Mesorhizobium TaxID=325217 RepID=UPI000BAE8F41|nr:MULTISPECIES: polymerase [unclassified Mesorhizobium]PBB24101.1 polymerase [Mesorhizobium sp. WSM4304]PBB72946.1 polymerase [Mesorhizobium sp. WSM4308]